MSDNTTNECGCSGGRCRPTDNSLFSRREFMEKLAFGAAGLAVLGDMASRAGEQPLPLARPRLPGQRSYPLTLPRIYRGRNLEAVAMPIGGIGSGSVWLDGQGRLAVWQIFNNLSEPRIPDSFFAIRARVGASESVTRVLQTTPERGLAPMASLEYEGGYPIARLTFHDPGLPIEVGLEAFNPMIPLDTRNSSIPCAVFRLTAKNPGTQAAEISFFATLQNAVGSGGASGIQGVEFAGYGGNRNHIRHDPGLTLVALERSPDPVQPGPIHIRSAKGELVPGPELVWLDGSPGLTASLAETLARIATSGGVALVSGASAGFFQALAALRTKPGEQPPLELFEDFEKPNYEGWTLTGDAFGKGPSHGTEAGQQKVSGFAGRGLVNTFIAGDKPQGTATSKSFRIQRRYIGFLIGGGSHKGQTCINLKVDGKVVRTATGKDREALEPASWDVHEYQGQEAVIEIVDKGSVAWDHINIDQIVFSDMPPEPFLQRGPNVETVAQELKLAFDGAQDETKPKAQGLADPWPISHYTRLTGLRLNENGYAPGLTGPDGDPLTITGPLGKGHVILALASGLTWRIGTGLLAEARGTPLQPGEHFTPGASTWGTMALAALDAEATALPTWTSAEELAAFISSSAPPKARDESASKAPDLVSPPGQTVNAALGVPFTLQPGESRTVTFALTWHFPNVQRFQHTGNLYNRWWPNAVAVARYLAENREALWEWTRLYHETIYHSNLPEEFLDAMTSQVAILRGPTCFWSEAGYFGGYEGSYGCCPLNCTHVWNYAQSHARLFPEIGRNMRVSNFLTFLYPSGETMYREHGRQDPNAFIDGQCACIEGAYREYQLSANRRFLEQVWPGVKKAVNWLIGAIDADHDGVPAGQQWNTYDTAVSGANTFIGSQYLCALMAGEQMALAMDDSESARTWREIREAGSRNQNAKLWGGEYFIQIPERPEPPKTGASGNLGPSGGSGYYRDYNSGCHADQLLGQWWAHTLGLGYLYPSERVKASLEALMKHNFRAQFVGFKQTPRRYIPDDEGGLLICTWPRGGRPKPFIEYADEVWTGIEYATAGAMIFEGLIANARQIVRTARGRYDGRRRDGVNSGPGGNPYNELECGKFYARAMSSWSLLIASQGLVLDGPKGVLGFKPNWQPEDHRSFFTAPEGWGLFTQRREPNRQTERIEVRYGNLGLTTLVFAAPVGAKVAQATVHVGGREVPAKFSLRDQEVRINLEQSLEVAVGAVLEVTITTVS